MPTSGCSTRCWPLRPTASWAQHWLDLARFAETDGFEHDKVRPNAWRYRDWLIDALNTDLPYNQFVLHQLAGDTVSAEATTATGFLLAGQDMPDINLNAERRHMVLNEMTATVGSVFLGLSIGCAQCHDHKADPISQADFYRMRAFFEGGLTFNEQDLGKGSGEGTRDDRGNQTGVHPVRGARGFPPDRPGRAACRAAHRPGKPNARAGDQPCPSRPMDGRHRQPAFPAHHRQPALAVSLWPTAGGHAE